MVQQSITNAKGQSANRSMVADIWGRADRRAQRRASSASDSLAHEDYVTLADGQVLIVPRANLAAAKGLLAAQRAAERRVAEQRAAQLATLNATREGLGQPDETTSPFGARPGR